MRYGTLSNEVQGRILVVWEGLLATLPDEAARRRFAAFDRVGARRRALEQYRTDYIARASLTDFAYRQSIPIDLVTLLGDRYAKKLENRVELESLPVSRVVGHTEDSLDEYARMTIFVVRVIHPFIARPMLFGGKGIPVAPGQPWSLW